MVAQAAEEDSMRRIEKSTRALRIGDVFYLLKQSNYAFRIVAQGPKVYAHVTGDDLNRATCHEHEDVWIDAPDHCEPATEASDGE